jgi:hypothetical protein
MAGHTGTSTVVQSFTFDVDVFFGFSQQETGECKNEGECKEFNYEGHDPKGEQVKVMGTTLVRLFFNSKPKWN